MATISDLHESISQMGGNKLLQFISDMRNRRRISKPKAIRKAIAKKKSPKQLDAFTTSASLTEKKKNDLLAKLLKIAK